MHSLIAALNRVVERDESACLVTVARVRGSAPREVGAKMLVSMTDTVGTIGGGQLEYQCIQLAVERLRIAESAVDNWTRTYPLGANCGQCCGGVVDVLFEPATAELAGRTQKEYEMHEQLKPFAIAVFGAGHVGSATVAALAGLNCQIRWIDSRQNVFPDNLPVNVVTASAASAAIADMSPNSYYLIMTHSHSLDLDICQQILQRRDALYCGLIGSVSKRRRFERLLKKQGVTDEMLTGLTCPIGVSGIPGKRPQEIAIAVAAELLQIQAMAAITVEVSNTNIVRAL